MARTSTSGLARSPKPSWVAAVSGGPDSMALLELCGQRVKAVCHVNYHARPTADRDERIVRDYCKLKNIPLFVRDARFAKGAGNFQDWARKVRYGFFVEVAKKAGCDAIATAHHADDHLETALMQMERGSSPLYYGIRRLSSYAAIPVVRPLLTRSKAELVAFLENRGVAYGVDETNASPVYARNAVRSRLYALAVYERDALRRKVAAANRALTSRRASASRARRRVIRSGRLDVAALGRARPATRLLVAYAFLADGGLGQVSLGQAKQAVAFALKARHGSRQRIGSGMALAKRGGLVALEPLWGTARDQGAHVG